MNSLKRRIAAVFAASTLAFSLLAVPASADDTVSDNEKGLTTFGIVSSSEQPNVSFSVPLYVTLAIVNEGGTAVVYAPSADAYRLTNLSASGYIAVSALTFQGLGTQGFRLISDADAGTYAGTNAALALTVAGQGLVSGTQITEKTKETAAVSAEQLLAGTSDFVYTTQTTDDPPVTVPHHKAIRAKRSDVDINYMDIALAGTMSASWLTNSNAETDNLAGTPQWLLTYTVSRCDSVGNLLDSAYTYSGAPSSYENYVWNAATKSFEPKAAP